MQNIENSDLYFFNNMYNDKIVYEEMINNRRKNFYQSLRHQMCVQGFKMVNGKMSDFVINPSINKTLGLPDGTYTLHLDYSIVPYYTKKRFLDKYGYNHPVTMNEIFENHRIFNHMLVSQIGDFFFFGFEVAEAMDGCYVILRMHRSLGIAKSHMDELIEKNESWTIFFQNQVRTYYAFQNKYLIFTGTVENAFYYIPLSTFKELSSMAEKPDSVNEWVFYCTCSNVNESFAMATRAVIVRRNGIDFVRISKDFANYCIANANNCKSYLMNVYREADHGIYAMTNKPFLSFTISDSKNPIPLSNIHVYAYDISNSVKKRLIAFEGEIQYPNRYNLKLKLTQSEMNDHGFHVYIHQLEATETQCQFDNNMKALIDCYDSQFYAKMNNEEFSPSVLNYSPTELTQYDSKSFMKSEVYPDIRAFRLKCLIEALQENPERYKRLIKRLYTLEERTIRRVYKESVNPSIFSRNVMNTSGEITDPEYVYHFSEPMMYFKVLLSEEMVPSAIVFVNGYRVNTEYIHSVGRNAYIYIKRSNLDNTKENIIELEVFCYDTKTKHKVETTMRFFSTDMPTIIEGKTRFDKKMSIGQFSFIDKKTNYHLKLGEIGFRHSLDEATIRPLSAEPIEFYFKHKDREFFQTSNGEYFTDDTMTALNVRQETVMEDIPYDSHKILNVSDLFLTLNSSFRVNDDIIITNNNHYQKCYQDDGMKKTSLTIQKFRGKLSPDRFRVYYGGKLLDNEDYELKLPSKYGEDVKVSVFNVSAQDRRRDILLEYLPVDETIIFNGAPDASVYHDGLFWFDYLDFPLIPEMMRVYINGVRKTESSIIDVGAVNVFDITEYKIGDTIKIFIPAIDHFAYDFQSSQMILNDEMKINDEFREFMIEKSKKQQEKQIDPSLSGGVYKAWGVEPYLIFSDVFYQLNYQTAIMDAYNSIYFYFKIKGVEPLTFRCLVCCSPY